MKLAVLIILATTLVAAAVMWLSPPPAGDRQHAMPWRVRVHDADRSEVFGIVLNQTTLAQARELFGQLEGVSVYRDAQNAFKLEAYFGKVAIGPISARLIANLAASEEELTRLAEQTTRRTQTESGSEKWILSEAQRELELDRVITALTFIPGYAGMEADYLTARFGQPASTQKVDDNSELWFYPETGVRILFDRDGREVFEYVAPGQFSTLLGGQP